MGITGSSTSLFATGECDPRAHVFGEDGCTESHTCTLYHRFYIGVYGIVKIVTTAFFLVFALEQLGRKWCLIAGGLVQAATMYWIAIFLGIRPSGKPLDGWSYATVAMVYVYVAGYGLGWSSVAWATSSEVAPNHLRAFTMSLASMTQWAFNCIIARITPNMLLNLKFGTFILFGTFTIAGCLWAAFLLPDTAKWPLERVDYSFKGNLVKRSIEDLSIRRRNQHREMVLAELADQARSETGITESVVPTLGVAGSMAYNSKDKDDDKR